MNINAKSSDTAGGNVKWTSHHGKQSGVSQRINIELPYDCIHPKEMRRHKKLFTSGPSSIIHNSQEMETTQMSIN